MPRSPNIQIYRPQLTSVLSIINRITGVALSLAAVVLVLWLLAAHTGSDHASFLAWLGTPLNGIAMILLLLALFHHTASGLQVVIEDYMHSRARFAAVLVIRLTCMAFATAGMVATLHVSLAR